jgi:hypothetical protein
VHGRYKRSRLTLVRRFALVLVVGLALAGCGGSSHPSDQAQIKSAYEKFFSSKTSLSDRVAVLQKGSQFKPVIQAFASNPLASNTSATVSSVTLQGANKAKVVYSVKVGGTALPTQTGSAVKENGTWKVADASLCKLVALGGTTPAICKS